MPLTHQYLRYNKHSCWGVVATATGNLVVLPNNTNYVAVPALEKVIIWDVRQNVKVTELIGGSGEVTALATFDGTTIAAGYSDGTVRIFDIEKGDVLVVLSGHTATVTVLRYDASGTKLVSGSLDTHVILWDVVSECGLYRLKGHKGPITDCYFMKKSNILITSSKDTYIKLWCLDTQHCFDTLTNGREEVWCMAVCSKESRLIAGSGTSQLRVWSITDETEGGKRSVDVLDHPVTCQLIGALSRKSKERAVTLAIAQDSLFCQNNDSTLEVFKIKSCEEKEKMVKRKRKKLAKNSELTEEEQVSQSSLSCEEEFVFTRQIKCGTKIRGPTTGHGLGGGGRGSTPLGTTRGVDHRTSLRSMSVLEEKKSAKVCCLFNNNKVQSFTVSAADHQTLSAIETPGHRTDIKGLRFTSDGNRVLTVCDGSAKLWSCKTQHCITTVECGQCLCVVMAPGDQYAVVGTKKGEVQLLDLAAGTLAESVKAHTGAVHDIAIRLDQKGFVTGSADKQVKFWEFTLVQDKGGASKKLGISHVQTLQMQEDVLAVQYSPNNKILAVGLLDCTVKVFFTDTLKFFLSLYGHKLPVTSMDISSDNTLLITGSADKNVKIWGLDFGDCHKSIFAHDEAVMRVRFVPDTHIFFSVSKDKKLKQWDADKFEHIQTLEGHHREVWCLDVSKSGEFLVTASHDKSIRLWERSDEALVVEEERELARDIEFESAAIQTSTVPGEQNNTEAEEAGKQTIETVKAAERIMEALEIYKEETTKDGQYQEELKEAKGVAVAKPIPHVILATLKMGPSEYVLDVIKKVRASELEEALLVLPFHYVITLFTLFDEWLKAKQSIELCCKALFFLFRIHHNQIVANQVLIEVMSSLNHSTKTCINEAKSMVGFNLAALKFIQLDYQENDGSFFEDISTKVKSVKKKKRAVLKTVV